MHGQVRAYVPAVPGDLCFLVDQLKLVGQRERVVGADFRAEPVLQGRDDPAPVGVVLGVRASDEHEIEREPQRVAAHADVALFQHVEQGDLDALGQVGQLVQAEDAPVGARYQAEVDGLRVAEGPALGYLHRVDVADQVADAGVGRGELFAVPLGPVPPRYGQVIAELRLKTAATGADRRVRVVVDLAAGDGRRPLVEQFAEGADKPRLPLAALPEQDDVVARKQGALDMGEHSLVEANDAREPFLSRAHAREQVLSDLLLHGAVEVAALFQVAQSGWPAVGSACIEFLAAVLHTSQTMSALRVLHLRGAATAINVPWCGNYFPASPSG